MAFRDDKEAAFARADALQRERDRLEAELAGANEERADLKEELEDKDRELAKLRKLAAAAEPQRRARTSKIVALAGALVAGLVMVGVAFSVSSREPTPAPVPQPQKTAAPEQPAVDPSVALSEINGCLIGADLDVRTMEFQPRIRLDRGADKRLAWCSEILQRRWRTHDLPAGTSADLDGYQQALAAWRPLADRLRRYYAEGDQADDGGALAAQLEPQLARARAVFIANSNGLRMTLASQLAARRSARIKAQQAKAGPGKAVYAELLLRVDVFMDALVSPILERARIEAALAEMVAFRDAHPEFDFEVLSKFLRAAKDLVRGLPSDEVLATEGLFLHDFRMLVAYYHMANLGA